MAHGFQARRGGLSAVLAPVEVAVLGDLLAQLLDLLGPERAPGADDDPLVAMTGMSAPGGGPEGAPLDPVLARLFPDANRDDPAAAAEFRRLTEAELRDGKRQAAREVLAALPAHGGRVSLETEAGEVWLGVLNDLRLALGTRLEVTQDEELTDPPPAADEAEPDSELAARLMALDVYHWLGFLQSSLLHGLAP